MNNIDENISVLSHHGVDCIKWYNKNSNRKQNINLISQRLPMCPCDVDLARWDPWFWPIRTQVPQQNNDSVCVDMMLREAFKPHGKVSILYNSYVIFCLLLCLSERLLNVCCNAYDKHLFCQNNFSRAAITAQH